MARSGEPSARTRRALPNRGPNRADDESEGMARVNENVLDGDGDGTVAIIAGNRRENENRLTRCKDRPQGQRVYFRRQQNYFTWSLLGILTSLAAPSRTVSRSKGFDTMYLVLKYYNNINKLILGHSRSCGLQVPQFRQYFPHLQHLPNLRTLTRMILRDQHISRPPRLCE